MGTEEIKKYVKELDMDRVISHSLSFFPAECNAAVRNANLLLDHVFWFQQKWDMEQTAIPYRMEVLNWQLSANGDEEWTFMLNRHEYLFDLIIAYYISRNDTYLIKWKELILHWIDHNPVSDQESSKAWRTIDTGIRCASWVKGMLHLISLNFITFEEREIILSSLRDQVLSLKGRYTAKYTLSNWGVLQTTGMISYLIWFGEDEKEADLLTWAFQTLEEQLRLQIMDDDMHWEQSPLYHVQGSYFLYASTALSKTALFRSQAEYEENSFRHVQSRSL